MSRIDLQIVGTANFAQIDSAIAKLRSQLASINSMRITGAIGPDALRSIDTYVNSFRSAIDASGMYERHLVNITNETEKFGKSLERGNLRLGQLYRTAMDYRRSETGQIRQLAREQVRMQNAVSIATGGGAADVYVPRGLDESIEKHRVLSQEYRILRQVVSNGSTELINWGKNTQWAGRQLTVGLTVPITMFGAAAAKAFMDADKELTRLSKVYGDATKGMVSSSDIASIRQETLGLAQDIASTMGVSVTETLGIAADIAATGKEGNELLGSTREAMRLSVLGEVDRQEAMRATLAIQTVFKQNTTGLTESINFLNAVENQTSTSLNDLVTGIVKAGPVVQGLGGEIKDLALMMVAMREGGIPASEAANAIKSSMGALINPTKQTTQVLSDFGIDLKNIVDSNAGNVIGTLIELQDALGGLDELSRQRAIEQIFGKFQFSRINALLNNLNKAGSQTEQVMALAEMSTTQLAATAERELTAVTESATGKFQRAFESLKANLIPIGETFAEVGTMLLNVGNKILEVFNALPDPVKNFFKILTMGTAVIGPLIMITGVLGNFFGYLVKGISTLMLFRKAGRGAFELLTPESAATMKATDLLTESLFDQTTAVNTMASAIDTLVKKLESLQAALSQTSDASSASSSVVLANAEASAATAQGMGGPYISPENPFMRRTGGSGLQKPGLTYSHLTPETIISGILEDQAKSVMGMGSFVYGDKSSEVNRLLGAFRPDVTSISESTVTDQQRRELLMSYGRSGGLAADKMRDLEKIISEMTSAELAQMLPSWEKISAQQSQYVGMLKSVQEGLSTNFDKTKVALEQYKKDVLSDGPEVAARRLLDTLRSLGIDVQRNIDETSAELERIKQEVQALPETERPAALANIVTERVTQQMELPAMQAIQASGVEGFADARKGFAETMMYAAQQMTDEMFQAGMITEELANAMREQISAHSRHALSLKSLEDAEKQLEKSSKNLAQTNEELAAKLESKGLRDDFIKGSKGWEYGPGSGATGKVEDKELINLLNTRKRQLEKEEESSNRLIDARDAVAAAEERLTVAEQELERETAAEAQRLQNSSSSNNELEAATEKLEAARLKVAQETAKEEARSKEFNAASAKFKVLAARKAELENQGLARTAEYNQVTDELSSTYATLLQLANEGTSNSKEFNLAQEELQQAMLEEASIREKVANAAKENVAATEKDTTETLQAAGAENQQEASAKKNAAGTDKDTVETLQAAGAENIQEQSALRNAAANDEGGGTGGGLFTKGGGKLSMMGAGLGSVLSMATMFMPTGENESLNTATNILGGAGMGASVGAMAGPWGALIGGIAGAAIPAVTAYVDAQQKVNDELVKYGQSLSGASAVMAGFGKELGRRSPAERLNEALSGLKIPQEQQQAAQSILESETGKGMLESARGMVGEERVRILLNQLKQLTLTEVFTPEEAKAVANELAIQLGDPSLGRALVEGIVSVLGEDGKLIKDAISKQFIDTIPTVEEILSNRPEEPTGPIPRWGTQEYIDAEKQAIANMSLTVGVLKQLSEAEAAARLSFQNGEISLQEYSDQMTEVNEKSLAAKTVLEELMLAGKGTLIGKESVIADIANIQGFTEEFDKVVDQVIELQRIIGTTDVFAVPLQTAAAYGQLNVAEIKQFQDLVSADTNIKTTVTAIFDQDGSEEYALEIIRMINAGFDPEKIKIILETEGVVEGVELINKFKTVAASLPTEVQARILGEINYDPAKMNDFVSKYDYINSLPDSKKELKAEVLGNPELKRFAEDWANLQSMSAAEIKTAIFQYLVTGRVEIPQMPTESVFVPNQVTDFTSGLDASAMASAATSQSSGGGGSSGGGSSGGGGGAGSTEAETKAIEERYDRQIEAQQNLIEKINEERDARQKVLDVQKEAMNFALREADLESQIARAKAEGDVAKAALLQGQLESEKKQYMMDEAERRRQEQEDARIKRAEEEIKRLEDKKQEELDKVRDASSGGGGSSAGGGGYSGGGISPEAQQELQQKIQFINDQLLAAVESVGIPAWTTKIYEQGASAFWDSSAVEKYKQALLKLGVPLDIVNQTLETMFDNIVTQGAQGDPYFEKIREDLEKVGVAGETASRILPNVFAILRDPSMTEGEAIKQIKQQLIDSGASAKEADRIVRKFLNIRPEGEAFKIADKFKEEFNKVKNELDPSAAEIASEEFLSGINRGLTREEILDNIKTRLEKAFKPEIPEGLSADAQERLISNAQQRAKVEFDAIKKWYEENPLNIPIGVQLMAGDYTTADAAERALDPNGADNQNPSTRRGPSGGPGFTVDDLFPSADEGAKRADETLQGYYERVLGYDVTPLQAAYFDKMAKTAMTALDSNSPSEVFKTIGNDAMQGFLDGINAFGTDGIAAAILGIVNVVNQGMAQTQITVPPLSPTGTGAGAVWASNFNDIVAEVLGYGVINSAFSAQITLMMETFRQIITGETGFNFVITEEATLAAESLYTILTERMQETADQINEILRTTLTGYAFDVVAVPKIYYSSDDAKNIWQRVMPNLSDLEFTSEMPSNAVEKAEGGYISGPGGPTDDLIPAMLSDGEYVIKASSVKHYGTGFLDEVNAGKFAEGGLVRLGPDNMTILGEKMAGWMNQFAGVPYNSGGEWADGPENGWGCATATRWLYDRFAGINIGDDSLSAAQYASGVGKQISDTMPGDQQFFYYANGVNVENPINHTGVAQSSSTMYHASGGSVGSYANDGIDTGARALAASRAGGTAQKRYLPETIVGMGAPSGYLKNGGFIRKLAGGGIANLFSTNISRSSGKTPEWPEDTDNPYPEDEPFVGMPDDMYREWLTYDFQMPYHQTSFGFKVPLFWMVDTTGLYTSTGPGPDDIAFDGEEWARRYKKVIEEWSTLEPTWEKLWETKPGSKAFKDGGFVAEGTPGSARGTGGRMAPSKPPEGEKSSPYFKKIQKVLSLARKHQSIPYGSDGFALDGPAPSAWGCATSLGWLWYNGADVNLPSAYRSYDQWRGLKKTVKNGAIMPGDLIFMKNPDPSAPNADKPVNHVEMYMGPSRQISKGGKVPGAIWNGGVGIQSLSSYPPIRNGIKRVLGPVYRAMGGSIENGNVYGSGGPTDDTVLAMLSNGEYVMSAYSVNKYGKDFMQRVNSGTLAEAAAGGLVSKYPSYVANLAMGGSVQKYSRGGEVDRDNTNVEYNINVNVAGTNASADEIAQTVLTHLKRKERMTGAVTRV